MTREDVQFTDSLGMLKYSTCNRREKRAVKGRNSIVQKRSTTFISNISCSHCYFWTKHYTWLLLSETKGFFYANPLEITDIYVNKSSWTL